MADNNEPSEVLLDPFLKSIPISEGFKLLDRCLLFAKIGQGGMGAVYRGRHLNLDIDVAVKCLKPDLSEGSSEFVQRFQREARVAAAINNEHLVRVFDVAESSGLHYLIMEYIPGETARERLRRKGSLSIDEAVTIAIGASKGLAVAHAKGLVHRDVKPDNIMIAQDGAVKLADLGLVRATESLDTLETATGMVMGTPRYMPPEQFENARGVGPAGDVWAMGAVLFFLLTGQDGIERGSLPEVMRRVLMEGFPRLKDHRPELPEDLDRIIARCTAPEIADRFAHAGFLVKELEAFLAGLGGETILADQSAGAGNRHNLVSPPPAQTLARLAKTVSEKPTELSAPPPEGRPAAESVQKKSSLGAPVLIMGLIIAALLGFLAWDRLAGEKETSNDSDEAKAETPALPDGERLPSVAKKGNEIKDSPIESPSGATETNPLIPDDRPPLETPESENPASKSDLAEPATTDSIEKPTIEEPNRSPFDLSWARPVANTALHPKLNLPMEVVHQETGIQMVLISAGAFMQGASPEDREAWPDEEPRHRVKISKPFYMGKFEVTNGQFRRFRPDHDSGSSGDGSLNGGDQPVVRVSWFDAEAFCKRYELQLPTEAQWEYACRAGTTTAYYGDLESSAWMSATAVQESQEGGLKGANDWMLFDTLGNVDEWCADYYASDSYKRFENREATDPLGPSRGQLRIVRGGHYLSSPRNCRASARNRSTEKTQSPQIGFRVIRGL